LGFRLVHSLRERCDLRKISASELLEQAIARIEALDQHLHDVVVRDVDRARNIAKTADAGWRTASRCSVSP
jgi:amidase